MSGARTEVEPTEKSLVQSLRVEARDGGVEVIEGLAERWRCLADQPFFRPEWVAAYVRAFAPEGELLVVTAWHGDELRAVLPLVKETTSFAGLPVRKLRGAANAHSVRFDLVRGAGRDGEAAVAAVWNFLRELPQWDVLELPDTPQGGGARELLRAAERDGFPTGCQDTLQSPYLALPRGESSPGWELGRTDAKFRNNLRRATRRLQGQGPVELRRIETADREALKRLYELEASGWKGQAGSAIACSGSTRAFYDEVAHNAERFGYLSLYSLESGERPIAGHFGLTYGGRYFLLKPAYDESYRKCAPGHLLVQSVLEDCQRRGLTEFDFCGPRMEWKTDWTPTVRPHATGYVFSQGIVGRVLYAAKFKLKSVVKRALPLR